MKKKIFIEGTALVEGHFSGVGQYVLGITRGIDELIEDAKYAGLEAPRVTVIIPRGSVKKFKSYRFKHLRYRVFPFNLRHTVVMWHHGLMPPIDLLYGRGTYIFPRFVGMSLLFSKSVLTIYDLSYELFPQYSDGRNARFLSKHVRKWTGKTDKIITISESVRQELLSFYQLADSKVAVAYPATDPKLFYRRTTADIERVKQKYNINGDYILALSNLEPRKNLGALVDAYCELPKKITDKYSLLLVGVDGWKTEALFDHIITKVNEGYNIIRPSKYVSDEDKPAIISGSSMLVYPSHYEGFGMPPLEALACGVPVISANNSSLPEAVGQAGKLIDIEKSDELTKTLKETFEKLEKISTEAIQNGPVQAARFSWKESARIFLDSIEEISP